MADKKIDLKTAKHTDAIVENTVARALPNDSKDPMEKRLTEHQRKELREVMRDGMRKRIDAGTINETVDTLKKVLGAPNDAEG